MYCMQLIDRDKMMESFEFLLFVFLDVVPVAPSKSKIRRRRLFYSLIATYLMPLSQSQPLVKKDVLFFSVGIFELRA